MATKHLPPELPDKRRNGVSLRFKAASRRLDDTPFTHLVADAPLSGFAAVQAIRDGYSIDMIKAASNFFGVADARIQGIAQVPASTASRLEVFGDKCVAIDWMRRPNRALGEVAPLELMDTEPGAVSVRQVLNAIATGGAA